MRRPRTRTRRTRRRRSRPGRSPPHRQRGAMTGRAISAISALGALLAALLCGAAAAQQPQGAGYVSNLSGPLFAVRADGTRRVLAIQSVVRPGDTLVTEDKTYARVRFTDTSEVTLRPGTQFQIEGYSFERQAPERDNV